MSTGKVEIIYHVYYTIIVYVNIYTVYICNYACRSPAFYLAISVASNTPKKAVGLLCKLPAGTAACELLVRQRFQ